MKQTTCFLLCLFLTCLSAAKVELVAGTNGDGLLANRTSLNVFASLQIDKRNNLYGCESTISKVRIINGTTGRLSTFSPSPWAQCRGFHLDVENDILFIGDEGLCKIFAIDLLTGTVQVVAGNGACEQSPDGTFVGNAPIGQVLSVNQAIDGTLIVGFAPDNVGRPVIRAINASGHIFTITDGAFNLFAGNYIATAAPRSFILPTNPLKRVDIDSAFVANASDAFASSGLGNITDEGLPVQDVAFSSVQYISIDAKGNIYVSEDNRVRIIDTNLTVFTVAGDRTLGNGYSGDGGLAVDAQMNFPTSTVVDSQGNLFIADNFDTTIRRVDINTKRISSLGNGFFSYSGDGGSALNAQLANPVKVHEDINGDLLISDAGNFAIRKVNSKSGIITTIAGAGKDGFSPDGTLAADALFSFLGGIVVRKNGDILFSENGGGRVRMIEKSSGKIKTFAGTTSNTPSGDGGSALNATLQYPMALALDFQENLFVCDQSNGANTIRRIDSATSIITSLAKGQIDSCFDVHVVDGDLYVSDNNFRIYKISAAGTVTIFAGNGEYANSTDGVAAEKSPMMAPSGMASDIYGNIYFVETFYVKKIAAKTRIISTVATRSLPARNGQAPYGAYLYYSSTLNSLFLTDIDNFTVQKISDLGNEPIASFATQNEYFLLLIAALLLIFVQ